MRHTFNKMLSKNKVKVDATLVIPNWKSNLKPILKWMSLIGLYSADEHNKGTCYRCKRIYCWFSYAFILVIESWVAYSSFMRNEKITENYTAKNSSAAMKWSILIDTFNYAIYIVLGTACALILTGPKEWTSLLDSIQKFQSLVNSTNSGRKEAKSIHNLSILLVIYIIISVILSRKLKYKSIKLIIRGFFFL